MAICHRIALDASLLRRVRDLFTFFLPAPLANNPISSHFAAMNDTDNTKDIPTEQTTPVKGKDKAKSDAAQERVAEALRANLRRRKVQSRDRSDQS